MRGWSYYHWIITSNHFYRQHLFCCSYCFWIFCFVISLLFPFSYFIVFIYLFIYCYLPFLLLMSECHWNSLVYADVPSTNYSLSHAGLKWQSANISTDYWAVRLFCLVGIERIIHGNWRKLFDLRSSLSTGRAKTKLSSSLSTTLATLAS